MSSATHILTLEEALALPVDPLDEIVNGKIRKRPPPEESHAALIDRLYRDLLKQLPESDFVTLVTAFGLGIRKEPALAVRNPDLCTFTSGQFAEDFESSDGHGYVWIAPKLVVECLSPSNRKGSIYQLLADYE
jgi:Uma2 family endonuclease